LNKLKFYGIKGNQYDLFKSYLSNRKQRTIIINGTNNNKVTSSWAKVTNGVPQGSILGPLLFIIYINDLPKILETECTPILFADDASFLIAQANSREFKNLINEVYNVIDDWFNKNLLSLNTTKTYYINFTTKNKVTRDMGDIGTVLTSTNHIKFLGLNIQNDITWDRHIAEVVKKLNTACYMIRNLKPMVSTKTLISVYYSYFHSIMTYGVMFWGNSSHAERIFKIQKRAIRIIKGISHRESCREHFISMKILPLRSQYIYSLLKFVVTNREIFDSNRDYYQINTRRNKDLHMNQVNLMKYGNGVFHMAVKMYNALPNEIKITFNNINNFKQSLKDFLYTNSFYTLNEFLLIDKHCTNV
jgi:hypothetical protein